jgi:hypothetical protein
MALTLAVLSALEVRLLSVLAFADPAFAPE